MRKRLDWKGKRRKSKVKLKTCLFWKVKRSHKREPKNPMVDIGKYRWKSLFHCLFFNHHKWLGLVYGHRAPKKRKFFGKRNNNAASDILAFAKRNEAKFVVTCCLRIE